METMNVNTGQLLSDQNRIQGRGGGLAKRSKCQPPSVAAGNLRCSTWRQLKDGGGNTDQVKARRAKMVVVCTSEKKRR